MTIIDPAISRLKEYDEETLKHMKKIYVMMIKDFMEICDENNIEYVAAYGTLLGAVRHEGFIPWDDDVDFLMTCENFNKFIKVMNEPNEKYELLSLQTTRDYLYMYSEVKLKHTRRIEHYHDNDNFSQGLSVDIFLLVNSPESNIKCKLWEFENKIYRRLLYIHEFTHNDVYVSENKQRIGRLIHRFLKTIKIDQYSITKFAIHLLNKYKDEDTSTFAVFSATPKIHFLKKDVIYPINKKLKFESLEINVPNDPDSFLGNFYGNYMEFPPEEERRNHAIDIDFGPYEDF